MGNNKNFSYADILKRTEEDTEEIKKEKEPTFQIDEVASVFFGLKRLQEKENITNSFEGYKVGAIYLFVMDLIRNHIEGAVTSVKPCENSIITDSFVDKVLKGELK